MVRQVAQESTRINDLAMVKAFDVITKALKTQRNFKNPEKEV